MLPGVRRNFKVSLDGVARCAEELQDLTGRCCQVCGGASRWHRTVLLGVLRGFKVAQDSDGRCEEELQGRTGQRY